MFDPRLTPTQQRVLGCLVEKQLSTPDYYPLTLNALINACNQSTNRDPVLALEEPAIMAALQDLRDLDTVWFVAGAGSRVEKYEHRLTETLGLSIQEAAILAELLLRGPQTPGEVRTRATRMYAFQDLQEVETVLSLMVESELAVPLPRQPGTKEIRYAHRLGERQEPEPGRPAATPQPSRAAHLEAELAALREDLAQLRSEFLAFKQQFD